MKWDDVYGSFKRFAAHTAVRLNQTADIASLQVKLSAAEKNLDDAYGLLGRISYQHFTSDDDHSERVLAAVKAVEQAKEEVKAATENVNEAKRRAAEQKAAYIQAFIGQTLEIVPENCIDGYTEGYSENYIRVYVLGEMDKRPTRVRAVEPFKDGVLAERI